MKKYFNRVLKRTITNRPRIGLKTKRTREKLQPSPETTELRVITMLVFGK